MPGRLMWLSLVLLFASAGCHSANVTPLGARELVLRGSHAQYFALEWPGAGTPIVMLHGLGGNAAWWAELAHRLPGRHVIALDLPGHGRSAPPSSWDYDPMAHDVVEAVRNRWPGSHIWIGHSWGGRLAVAVAAADSGARGLVLLDAVQASPFPIDSPEVAASRFFAGELDPWPSMDSALTAVQRLSQYQPWAPELETAFRRGVRVESGGRVVPLLTRQKAGAIFASFAGDISADVAAIHTAVLVVSAPRSYFERAQRALFPGAEFVSLSGNHWLQISNPDGLAAAVSSWLRSHAL